MSDCIDIDAPRRMAALSAAFGVGFVGLEMLGIVAMTGPEARGRAGTSAGGGTIRR